MTELKAFESPEGNQGTIPPNLLLGTCSWNYPSWKGLVYTRTQKTAADYLGEYARHFDTAEIDSWFYKIPSPQEAAQYDQNTPDHFVFTTKVWQNLSLTHRRSAPGGPPGAENPEFLSVDGFKRFHEATLPLADKIAVYMFEFEYLNKAKMESVDRFIDRFGEFKVKIDPAIPLGIEIRNKNYLTPRYFRFLQEAGIIHVFSQKQYMPHFYTIFQTYRQYLGPTTVLRLLGGDRKAIEQQTGNTWNQIVDEKPDTRDIINFSVNTTFAPGRVIVNVNNHYEGSAPLTIQRIRRQFGLLGNPL